MPSTTVKQLAKPKSYLVKPSWVRPGWETYYWQLNRSIRIGPARFDPYSAENNTPDSTEGSGQDGAA